MPVAVYFAYEDRELTEIYDDIKTAVTSDQAGSAFEGMHKYLPVACSFIERDSYIVSFTKEDSLHHDSTVQDYF